MTDNIDDMVKEFIDDGHDQKDEALALLDIYVNKQISIEDEIEKLEKDLASLKRNLLVYSTGKIPELLIKHNLVGSTIKHGGRKINVKPFVSGSIKEGNRDEAFKWLEDNKFGDIIDLKVELKFKPDEKEDADKAKALLSKGDFEYVSTKGVHHSRLKSFLTTRMREIKEAEEARAEGTEPEAETNGVKEFPKKLFGVYEGYVTKIER